MADIFIGAGIVLYGCFVIKRFLHERKLAAKMGKIMACKGCAGCSCKSCISYRSMPGND